jgi:hypothetical protein
MDWARAALSDTASKRGGDAWALDALSEMESDGSRAGDVVHDLAMTALDIVHVWASPYSYAVKTVTDRAATGVALAIVESSREVTVLATRGAALFAWAAALSVLLTLLALLGCRAALYVRRLQASNAALGRLASDNDDLAAELHASVHALSARLVAREAELDSVLALEELHASALLASSPLHNGEEDEDEDEDAMLLRVELLGVAESSNFAGRKRAVEQLLKRRGLGTARLDELYARVRTIADMDALRAELEAP